MVPNENTIIKFYTAFANSDVGEMCACYHPDFQFRNLVFVHLKGNQVCQLWRMLIDKNNRSFKIDLSDVEAYEHIGSARCVATNNFNKTTTKVINSVAAKFHFQDGLIIKNTDDFDIWKWYKQATGIKGLLLMWTGFFQN